MQLVKSIFLQIEPSFILMKRLCFFFLLCVEFPVLGQDNVTAESGKPKAEFGFKTGANFSELSASINSESSMTSGFHVGMYVKLPLSEKTFFRPELVYSSQGQKDNYQNPSTGASLGATTTTLNYLNVPLLFETGKKSGFQFGPQLGFFLSGHEVGTVNGQKVNDDLSGISKSIDLSFVLGLSIDPFEHFHFGLRYQYGLTPVFNKPTGAPSDYPSPKNRVINVYAAFSF
jgi:hypothetical protein